MKRILIIIITCIFIPIINIKALEIYSENAVLYNMNEDKIIYEKNSEEKVKVASLTKIMTTIVALENIDNIKEQTDMPKEALIGLEDYVTTEIKANDIITYEDLLYGIMLPSGADCANAIALKVSGNIDDFVKLMNEKAKELNLEQTHFSNPIGIDEDNYSSVNDIAKLLKYALNNEEFYKIFTTRNYKTSNNIDLESTIIEKSEPDNIDISYILGSKTGFTDDAGNCLASIAKINNVKYLLVTTKAGINHSYHIMDATNIYDYFSKNYSYKKVLDYDKYIKTIKIQNGINKDYNIYADEDAYIYLNNEIDTNELQYEYEGLEELTKGINKNDKIGKLTIKYNNDIIYTYDILLNKNITFYNQKLYIGSLIATVLIALLFFIKRIKENNGNKKTNKIFT